MRVGARGTTRRYRRAVRTTFVSCAAVIALLLAGCSSSGSHDPLQVTAKLAAATPAPSPVAHTKPAGTVIPVDGDISAVTIDPETSTLAVAVSSPPSLRLYSTRDLGDPAAHARVVTLPAPAGHLSVAGRQLLVPVPDADALFRVDLPDGAMHKVSVPGGPTDALQVGDTTAVAVPKRGALVLLRHGAVSRTITGSAIHPEQVLSAGGHTVVLDRLRSALFDVDLGKGTFGAGRRAGQGAVNAVADSFGRVLVTDARQGGMLAFSADPVTERQLFPVPGGPYGIAYDAKQHLAWVTATGSNQVVGYDVAGGEPVEKKRIPTVRQPDAVAVDQRNGAVVVVSAAGKGIQVVHP